MKDFGDILLEKIIFLATVFWLGIRIHQTAKTPSLQQNTYPRACLRNTSAGENVLVTAPAPGDRNWYKNIFY
jgi:hypothetical protein